MYGALFYSGAQFSEHYGETGLNIFRGTFCMMFGAFAAGQAQSFGPDLGAAK